LSPQVPPDSLCVATFAAGCFWGVEALFQYVPGVIATSVGYTGGTSVDPTYEQVCAGGSGHAEAVQIVFDPERISYRELLERFWENHDATRRRSKEQYRSAVFAHSRTQEAIAIAAKLEVEQASGGLLTTEIVPLTKFYRAEERHQRYLQKRAAAAAA
jgi:peptide-methionine (S)-S-oxide reductase